MNAAQVIDLVDKTKTLARRDRRIRRVISTANVNTLRRADTRAEFTSDALLHTVFITVKNMATMEALWLLALLLRVEARDARLKHLLEGHTKTTKARH